MISLIKGKAAVRQVECLLLGLLLGVVGPGPSAKDDRIIQADDMQVVDSDPAQLLRSGPRSARPELPSAASRPRGDPVLELLHVRHVSSSHRVGALAFDAVLILRGRNQKRRSSVISLPFVRVSKTSRPVSITRVRRGVVIARSMHSGAYSIGGEPSGSVEQRPPPTPQIAAPRPIIVGRCPGDAQAPGISTVVRLSLLTSAIAPTNCFSGQAGRSLSRSSFRISIITPNSHTSTSLSRCSTRISCCSRILRL